MKKILIILAIVIVAFIALSGLKEKQKTETTGEPQTKTPAAQTEAPAPPPIGEEAPTPQNIITFSNSGYSPSTLTVNAGTTIAFKNSSSTNFWPASAIHPIHSAYPTTGGCIGSTFDACKSIAPGGDWSFKFDIKGTWKYHDHLSPGFTGTIIVK